MIDTNELRKLCTSATPGPWTQWEGHGWVMAVTPEANEKGYMAGTDGQVCSTDCADFSDAQWIKNAEFIAAANPATMLQLLDEVDRLRSDIEGAAECLSNQRQTIARLQQIEKAARNLAKVKGRHHSEQAYQKMVEVLG